MAKGCVYIPKTGKDAGKVFGSKESLAAHMNYTPALTDLMAKFQQSGGKADIDSVTKWLTDNGYLKAGQAKPTTTPVSGAETNEQKVERLRAEEQTELAEAIPNIESYKVNGKIDKGLMTPEDLAKYNEIYNRYDKKITPLLPTTKKVGEAPKGKPESNRRAARMKAMGIEKAAPKDEAPQPKPQATQTELQMPERVVVEKNNENINSLIAKKSRYNSLPKTKKAIGANLLEKIKREAADMGFSVITTSGLNIKIVDAQTRKPISKRGVSRTSNKEYIQKKREAQSLAETGQLGLRASILNYFIGGKKINSSQSELGEGSAEIKSAERKGLVSTSAESIDGVAGDIISNIYGDIENAPEGMEDKVIGELQDVLATHEDRVSMEEELFDLYEKLIKDQEEAARYNTAEDADNAMDEGLLDEDSLVEYYETQSQINKLTEDEQEKLYRELYPEAFEQEAEGTSGMGDVEGKKSKREKRKAAIEAAQESIDEAVNAIEQGLSESGIKVEVKNDNEYNADKRVKGGQGRGSEGVFIASDGTVIINRDKVRSGWGKTVVFHEGVHPIINIIRNTDPERYAAIVDGIKNETERNNQMAGVVDFANKKEYTDQGPQRVEDELVAETFARIASGKLDLKTLDKSFFDIIIDFINSIRRAMRLAPVSSRSSDQEFRNAAKQISNLFNKGGKLSQIVGRANVKAFQAAGIQPSVGGREQITLKDGSVVQPTEIQGSTTFYHASSKKRQGRLVPNTAPQWGKAVYFAGSRQAATDEFGGQNVTEASLSLKNPVYTNSKEFEAVTKKAAELYNKAMLPQILKDEAERVNGEWRFFDEDLQAEYDKNGYIDRYSADDAEEGKYFGEAAQELGHDAIIDEGGQYGTEIAVLDESAIIYPEDVRSTSVQPSVGGREIIVNGQPVQVKPLPEGTEVVNGFYSPIEKNLRETKAERQSANKWLTSGIIGKGDEAVYTGVKGWLESKKPNEQVSKQEVLDFMKNNRIQLVEVVKGGQLMSDEEATKLFEDNGYDVISDLNGDTYVEKDEEIYDYNDMTPEEQRAFEVLNRNNTDAFLPNVTKFHQYQLEGEKSNYKEVLVTLPEKYVYKYDLSKTDILDEGNFWSFYEKNGDLITSYSKRTNPTIEDAKDTFKIFFRIKEDAKFASSHFDEPDILVHLRMNTRTDADGNKVLFLEEIQSDWGQEGKRKGFEVKPKSGEQYRSEIEKIEGKVGDIYINKDNEIFWTDSKGEYVSTRIENGKPIMEEAGVVDERGMDFMNSIQTAKGKVIPSAPFVTDTNAWTKLGLKIAIQDAVKQGVDKIAWTTGEQQNDRYDLSKVIESITVKNDGLHKDGYTIYKVKSEYKSGEETFGNYRAEELPDVLGKDLADKILSDDIQKGESEKYEGIDLKVGGKGMIGFYGSVEQGKEGIVGAVAKAVVKDLTGKPVEIGEVKINSNNQASIDVTPELEAAVQRGIPQFSFGGREDIQNAYLDAMDAVDEAIDSGISPSQAVLDNVTSQGWYKSLSKKDKAQVDKMVADEFGPEAIKIASGLTASISNIIDNYYKLKDGDRSAKDAINEILDADPKLKYIYDNIRKINKQLQDAGVITDKTDGCP